MAAPPDAREPGAGLKTASLSVSSGGGAQAAQRGNFGWLAEVFAGQSVAQAILLLCAVAAIGLAIGSIKNRGAGLGIAGVLFAGLVFGHFGVVINPKAARPRWSG